jgi:short-subunit dehydrogenase
MNSKCLIVGGTANIAPYLINELNQSGYSIDLTYSNIENFKNANKYEETGVTWFYLDFKNKESLTDLVNEIPENYYSIVIILSMTTPGDFLENTEKELRDFYGNYLVNNMLLGKHLLDKITNNGKIVYISSVAGNKPVPSINYSTLKGALQSFYMSLSTKIKPPQTILTVIPGLIYDTPAFYRHDPIVYNNDINTLTTKQEILDLILNSSHKDNGAVIRLGRDL